MTDLQDIAAALVERIKQHGAMGADIPGALRAAYDLGMTGARPTAKPAGDPLLWLPRDVDMHMRYRVTLRVRSRPEADGLLDDLAEDFAKREGVPHFEARELERKNIGYWAHTFATRAEFLRVATLFGTGSPVFALEDPDARVAFWSGVRLVRDLAGKRTMRHEEITEMLFWTRGVGMWKV